MRVLDVQNIPFIIFFKIRLIASMKNYALFTKLAIDRIYATEEFLAQNTEMSVYSFAYS